MIRLSMNVLTSALALLRRIEIYDFSSLSELSYSKIVSISAEEMLAILSPDEILPYIPTNNLDGQWETVKIPFLCFEDKFVEIA